MNTAGPPEQDSLKTLREKIGGMPRVSGILSFKSSLSAYEDEPVNVFYYSDEMIERFMQKPIKGRWLDGGAESLEAVIGGVVWPGVPIVPQNRPKCKEYFCRTRSFKQTVRFTT